MFEVIIERNNRKMLVLMNGAIEENTNFAELIGHVEDKLEIDCQNVIRINSVGVRSWFKYFQYVRMEGTELVFKNCSPSIVQQLNSISNFACGGRVESIALPFSCADCAKEFSVFCMTDEILKSNFEIPVLKCLSCERVLHFDDDPDEYFSFLDIYTK